MPGESSIGITENSSLSNAEIVQKISENRATALEPFRKITPENFNSIFESNKTALEVVQDIGQTLGHVRVVNKDGTVFTAGDFWMFGKEYEGENNLFSAEKLIEEIRGRGLTINEAPSDFGPDHQELVILGKTEEENINVVFHKEIDENGKTTTLFSMEGQKPFQLQLDLVGMMVGSGRSTKMN